MDKKREKHQHEVERKRYPELGKGNKENITVVSLTHRIT